MGNLSNLKSPLHMQSSDIFYLPSYLGVGLYETDNTPFHFFLLSYFGIFVAW